MFISPSLPARPDWFSLSAHVLPLQQDDHIRCGMRRRRSEPHPRQWAVKGETAPACKTDLEFHRNTAGEAWPLPARRASWFVPGGHADRTLRWVTWDVNPGYFASWASPVTTAR